jgi:hypothetical protein
MTRDNRKQRINLDMDFMISNARTWRAFYKTNTLIGGYRKGFEPSAAASACTIPKSCTSMTQLGSSRLKMNGFTTVEIS